MKKFSAFLTEAERSFASKDAEKLGLKHVAYGRYADPSGNITHVSKDGKLVKLSAADAAAMKQGGGEDGSEEAPTPSDMGSVSITFGRFNPPTIGHETLIKRVAREAKGGEYRIYPSQSQDPKKNPLGFAEKVKYMKQAYPDHADAIQSGDARTIFDVLTSLNDEGYSEVKIVVGGDRVSEFNSLAQKYNGDLYEFENILVVSAGDRDPDADGVEGMSASKMRKAAAEDDFKTFEKGIPSALGPKDKLRLYRSLRSNMQLESLDDFHDASFQLFEVAPKLDPQGLREAYLRKEIFNQDTYVENVNTGVIGKIVNRGSNYVIYVDENEKVYRSWLRDLLEVNDIKMFDFTPAGEVGTPELRDYMRKLTPGEFIKKINKKDKDTK